MNDGRAFGGKSSAGNVVWNSQSIGRGSVGLVESHAPTTVTFWKDGSPVLCMAIPESIACAESGTEMMGKGELYIYEKGILMSLIDETDTVPDQLAQG